MNRRQQKKIFGNLYCFDAYTTPYTLEEFLSIPEFAQEPEIRYMQLVMHPRRRWLTTKQYYAYRTQLRWMIEEVPLEERLYARMFSREVPIDIERFYVHFF